jgi:hypothetical protein
MYHFIKVSIIFIIVTYFTVSCKVTDSKHNISKFTIQVDNTTLVFPFKKFPNAAQIDLDYAGRTEMPDIVYLQKDSKERRNSCFTISIITYANDTLKFVPVRDYACIYIDNQPIMSKINTNSSFNTNKIITTP